MSDKKHVIPRNIMYTDKVSLDEMEQAVSKLRKEGYPDAKVIACPYWKGIRDE